MTEVVAALIWNQDKTKAIQEAERLGESLINHIRECEHTEKGKAQDEYHLLRRL